MRGWCVMRDLRTVLLLLQHGDSAFPAGGFAFSWGIEGLEIDGHLPRGRTALQAFVTDQLIHRWASMDRVLLRQAFVADEAGLQAVDFETEALTLSAEMRAGSQRAGRALIGVHARLGGPLAKAYRARLDAGAPGHLPPAQAIAARDIGLDLPAAEILSGWSLITGLVSAAVRLGTVGHLDGQKVMTAAAAQLDTLLAREVDPDPSAFTPVSDIAIARAPLRAQRMFAT